MSALLTPDSPHYVAAKRFADELTLAMRTRKVGRRRLALALGVKSATMICHWKAGTGLPRLESAQAVADALQWPKLAVLVREARTKVCARPGCGITFVEAAGGTQKFHNAKCQVMMEKLRVLSGRQPRVVASGLERELTEYRASVHRMCQGCEPEGACQTPSCALRPLSPFPLVQPTRTAQVATPGPGPYGSPENRAKTIAAVVEVNAKRWTPEEREAWRQRMIAWHASHTAEERTALGKKVQEGRKRKALPEAVRHICGVCKEPLFIVHAHVGSPPAGSKPHPIEVEVVA